MMIFVIIFIFWNSTVLYPLKLFTVFLHELAHGLAAVMVGAGLHKIEINPLQGGFTLISTQSFFSKFFITSSGYVGSVLFGAIIIILGSFEMLRDKVLVGIGILLMLVAFFYGKWMSFTTLFAVAFLIIALAVRALHSPLLDEYLIDIIGTTNMTYAVIDIWDDTISRRDAPSDAYKLYELTHIPAFIWGVLWIFMTLLIIYYTFQVISIIQRKKRSL